MAYQTNISHNFPHLKWFEIGMHDYKSGLSQGAQLYRQPEPQPQLQLQQHHHRLPEPDYYVTLTRARRRKLSEKEPAVLVSAAMVARELKMRKTIERKKEAFSDVPASLHESKAKNDDHSEKGR
ncbi:hypothetical protein BC937DRAFT_88646 [Endogone sp. FLAS-F59071]|nr:hypothetical protein BC937DRAFT_88646 [Endogone sp. FLAS-F59071]|eukprot:RUS18534.1 hypothetical protein BC937DRAFT_88646 [Endogone sp. FLAS-F59071]